MKISAVIGAQYGDEGKGLVTDYLSDEKSLVVRFNGGSQAGHTVTTPEGTRHVFSHFGSGTLNGGKTFLSKFFIANPFNFFLEYGDLNGKGVDNNLLRVFIDPRCIITTPYDIMINQAREEKLGHGSCGQGINETVVRSENFAFNFTMAAISNWSISDIKTRLKKIRDVYVPMRLSEQGITLSDKMEEHLYNDNILLNFMSYCDFLEENSIVSTFDDKFFEGKDFDHVVFEGAQGLKLDENHPKNFPHVTRSSTGIKNVLELVEDANLEGPIDAYYLTRSYTTRHGAGPLPGELDKPPYANVKDDTNIHNEHQGSLRFAPLDLWDIFEEVDRDLSKITGTHVRTRIKKHLVITCMDQLDTPGVFKIHFKPDCPPWNPEPELYTTENSLEQIMKEIRIYGFNNILLSYGPTRNTMEHYTYGWSKVTS